MSDDNDSANLGCTIAMVVIVAAGWYGWKSVTGCVLADQFDYVTKTCAAEHLKRPACNDDRDILDVDDVTDTSYTDNHGKREELRTVIYSFRQRPTSGPVSAAIMRDTVTLFKTNDGKWLAGCENPPSK